MSQTPAHYHVVPFAATVMQCPVAGFQYHGGEAVWSRLGVGHEVVLRREPGNRQDPRAIRIDWGDVPIGYVPREANFALSQMMDGGATVKARIVSRRECTNPWDRLMIEVVWIPDGTRPAPLIAPAPPATTVTPQILIQSLANRVFGPDARTRQVAWIASRFHALVLAGIEHPHMLPFLRFVAEPPYAEDDEDPLATLQRLLHAAGMDPAAWKRLPRWTFLTFELLPPRCLGIPGIARLANLLLRLDAFQPPSRHFVQFATFAGLRHTPDPDGLPDFERYPTWFMRALFRAVEEAGPSAVTEKFVADLRESIDWFIEERPDPDANQQKAGWPWIVAQARAHAEACRLAAMAPWPLPVGDMTVARFWAVPLGSPAELFEESAAMKNCLDDYAEVCDTGNIVVFSVRDALTSERIACFSVLREGDKEPWVLEEIAGPMNEPAGEEARAVATEVLGRMNASR